MHLEKLEAELKVVQEEERMKTEVCVLSSFAFPWLDKNDRLELQIY